MTLCGLLLELQVGIFVGIAMVLRQKPDVLISQLPTLMDHPRYQGQDKIPLYVWVISQVRVARCQQFLF